MKAEKASHHNEKRTDTFHNFPLRFFLIKVSEWKNIFIQKKKDRNAFASYPHLL
ncbi:hypothetical protein CN440_09805 [Bacillus cereus]|nr:hypothetical protein CN440_09805 [Bacillus cereus]